MGAPPPIRLSVAIPKSESSLLRGIEFGLAEARKTAGLLGRTVERNSAGTPAFRINGPVVTISANGRTFRVAPIDRTRVAWLPTLQKFGAGELNERFLRETRHPMDEAAWLGWVAVKIVTEAALRESDLAKIRIDGHKGVPLYFDAAGNLVQPLYDRR